MESFKTYDLIIVGGGPSAMSAALYAAREKINFLIISKESGGQLNLITKIDNYLGFQNSSGIEVLKKFKNHLNSYNINLIKDEVLNIKSNKKNFVLETKNKSFKCRSLIIATGRISRKLNVPGEIKYYGKGISSCTICDAALFNQKDVAVVGSGNSALQAVLHLSEFAKKIYLLTKYKKLKGDRMRIEELMKLTKKGKAKILYESKIKEIIGKIIIKHHNKLKTLEIDGMFIEIGMTPKTDMIDFVNKNEKNEIIINQNNETNVPGIFAAGDCTNIPAKQLAIAVGEGAKAALNSFNYLRSKK